MSDKIVISIPINLKNRQQIASALENKYGTEYVFIGRVFQSTNTNNSCEIEICDAQVNLADALEIAGQDQISAGSIQQIIYLISSDTGYDACWQIAQLAQVFLNIGGIAIKVESAGITHQKEKWQANYNSDDVFDIYSLYVVLLEGDNYYYSCGMHNFGKIDVAIAITEEMSLAIYVINVFNYYRLTESPILQDGHTFQPDIESPIYRIKWIADHEYETDSFLYNPHGRWHLTRVC